MKGFHKTRLPNLWRNDASGRFYAVTRVPGKAFPVAKSLKTDKESIAKLRLPIRLAQIRAAHGNLQKVPLSLGQCAETYLKDQRDLQLKARSAEYCESAVKMIRKHRPGFDDVLVEQFSRQDCKDLAATLRAIYSPSRFNGALWALRGILKVALKAKVISENYAMDIIPEKVVRKHRTLPTKMQMAEFMTKMKAPDRKNALLFVKILLEHPQRPEHVRRLRVEHVDFNRRVLMWPPMKHNESFNELPMSKALMKILKVLVDKHPGDGSPLVPIADPKKALTQASKAAGIEPVITPGLFRHLWSTRAAKKNIPVAVAAKFRGDKDGGAMYLKTYVHLNVDDLRPFAEKMSLKI